MNIFAGNHIYYSKFPFKFQCYPFLDMLVKERIKDFEKLLKSKEDIPDIYTIDEIDVDSYFFYNFLDIATVYNRIIRIGQGIWKNCFAIKKFTFQPDVQIQSYIFASELQLNRSQTVFVVSSLCSKFEVSKTIEVSIPIPHPKSITSPTQSALFFHSYSDYQKSGIVRVGLRYPNFYIQRFDSQSKFVVEIDLKYKEVEYIVKSKEPLMEYILHN